MDPAFLGLVVDEHPAGKGRRCQDPRLQVAPLKIDHERKLSPPDAPPHAEKLWERPVLAVPVVHDGLRKKRMMSEQRRRAVRTDQERDARARMGGCERLYDRGTREQVPDGPGLDDEDVFSDSVFFHFTGSEP